MNIFLSQQKYFEIAIGLRVEVKVIKFKYYKQILPFHCLKRLKSQFGAMCISPEHRLSMELKEQELLTNKNAEI